MKKSLRDKENKEIARNIITTAVDSIAKRHGYAYNRIAIRNQKTRLGSCSSKKNLNFNWQIIKFPKSIMEYVIKHELAHLAQPNHSRYFWKELEKIDPNYKKHHDWVMENAHKYISL